MTCQACGTDQVSLEAAQASARMVALPFAARAVLEESFGEMPSVLCAGCFLMHYADAIQPRAA